MSGGIFQIRSCLFDGNCHWRTGFGQNDDCKKLRAGRNSGESEGRKAGCKAAAVAGGRCGADVRLAEIALFSFGRW